MRERSGHVAGVALLALCSGLVAAAASAATFVVNSAGDEPDADVADSLCATALGTCTLRAAIEQSNALPGADTITFNIPGPGVHTITPASPLPALTDDAGVTIDGYTQPGSRANTLAIGNDAVLTIEIDGTAAGESTNGLRVVGTYATVRGLVINRFGGAGILIANGYGHQIGGCFLGTNPTGTIAKGNLLGLEIFIGGPPAASDVPLPSVALVGGLGVADRNLLSGNSSAGLVASFGAKNCVIQNNYIGTDASGDVALPNLGGGMAVIAAEITVGGGNLFFGGRFPGANVVSGNVGSGILLAEGGASFVAGNMVGTNARGVAAIPNGTGIQLVVSPQLLYWNLVSGNSLSGIRVLNSTGAGIAGNRIGTDLNGNAPLGNGRSGIEIVGASFRNFVGGGTPNTIAYNQGPGVSIGATALDESNDNGVFGNSIHDNGGLGIDLGNDGVSANNDCDTGRGPNLGQNAPVLTSAVPSGATTTVRGTLNSVPNSTFYIDVFANALCDPSGFGEGETYITEIPVMTDGSCNASFEAVLPVSVALGSVVTATATDAAGNTSEFSACRPVTAGQDFYTITQCRVADTRDPPGPFGGPALTPAADRLFAVAGRCGIPADAAAVAFNFTVTQSAASGDIQVFSAGTPLPVPATIFYSAGRTLAKNGILALGVGGAIGTHVTQSSGTVDLIIDATGYFR